MKKAIILTSLMAVFTGSLAYADMVHINCEVDSQNQKFELSFQKGATAGPVVVTLDSGENLNGQFSIARGTPNSRTSGAYTFDLKASHYIPGFSKPYTILKSMTLKLLIHKSYSTEGYVSFEGLDGAPETDGSVSCGVQNF